MWILRRTLFNTRITMSFKVPSARHWRIVRKSTMPLEPRILCLHEYPDETPLSFYFFGYYEYGYTFNAPNMLLFNVNYTLHSVRPLYRIYSFMTCSVRYIPSNQRRIHISHASIRFIDLTLRSISRIAHMQQLS